VLVVMALGVALRPLAHPFPSSTLTISPETGGVKVILTIPVPELIIARPTLTGLGGVPKNASLPAPQQKDLVAYLREHMTFTLADHLIVDLQLISAQVQVAQNADVGNYDLVVVEMAAPLQAEQSLFMATLTYDAVLHEVRNHHTTVWLAQPGHAALPLGEIWFDAALGRAHPLVLSEVLPQDRFDNSGMPSLYKIIGAVAALIAMLLVYMLLRSHRRRKQPQS
jgi:hypothetical protein